MLNRIDPIKTMQTSLEPSSVSLTKDTQTESEAVVINESTNDLKHNKVSIDANNKEMDNESNISDDYWDPI